MFLFFLPGIKTKKYRIKIVSSKMLMSVLLQMDYIVFTKLLWSIFNSNNQRDLISYDDNRTTLLLQKFHCWSSFDSSNTSIVAR